MAQLVKMTLDDSRWRSMFRAMDSAWEPAASSAMNKSIAKVRTQVIRETASEAKVSPAKLIRRRLRTFKATAKKLRAGLGILVRPIPLIRLSGARQTRSGVSARGGHSHPSAFINTARSPGTGNKQVYRRLGKSRYPLEVLKVEVKEAAESALAAKISAARDHFVQILPREVLWRARRQHGSR